MNGNTQTIQSVIIHKKSLFQQKGFWLSVIFLVSFAFRAQDFYLFREFNADKAHQLQAAYELLQGHGVSLKTYDLNTFAAHQRPLLAWPPGYSYLVAGVSGLFGASVYNAAWMIDVLAFAILWCALLWFTIQLRFTLFQTGLLFLLAGFCRTPWIYTWSADALGTALFLLSAAANLYFVQKKSRSKIDWIGFALAQSGLVGAMCFLKYSLLPAYLSLAFSLFSFSWREKQKHFRTGFFLLAAAAVTFALLQLYNRVHSVQEGDAGNLYLQQTGWFFGNLKMYSAFLLKSFVYIDGFLDKANSQALLILAQLLNALLVAIILLHIGKRIWKGGADYFSHLVFVTTISICGFMAFLSVRYGQQVFVGTYRWTYVKEVRYFLPVVFLLAIYLIRHFHPRMPRTAFNAFAFAAVAFVAFYGLALHGYYKLTGNRAGSFDNLVGKLVRAKQYVNENRTGDTYFVAMTGNSAIDAEVTSLAAMDGTKVVISYDGIFPDDYLSPLFSKSKTLPSEKRVIVYLSNNLRVVDSLNPLLPRRIEGNTDGEKFLIVNP